MYYAIIENDIITGKSECPCTGDNVLCIEISAEIYNNLEEYIYLNGEIVVNPNYERAQQDKADQIRISEIKKELKQLDIKRIRAICEPCEYSQGFTWLDFYNNQVQELRLELQKLEGTSSNDNHNNK